MENKIQALEIGMAEFKKDINYLKKSQEESKEQNSNEHQQIMEKIDNFVDGCDNKYAQKDTQWAEKFLLWAGMIIGATMLVGLITLIAKGYIQLNK